MKKKKKVGRGFHPRISHPQVRAEKESLSRIIRQIRELTGKTQMEFGADVGGDCGDGSMQSRLEKYETWDVKHCAPTLDKLFQVIYDAGYHIAIEVMPRTTLEKALKRGGEE